MNDPRFTPGKCANCDAPGVPEKSPLFCSSRCRDTAKLIRYVRSCREDGRWQRPDVRSAVRTRVALILGGGYRERERRVTGELRALVFRRAGGRCEECGRPLDFDGTSGDPGAIATIQHVSGGSNDLSNLRAFCGRCNVADAESHFVPVQPGSTEEKMSDEIRTRCFSLIPLRLCDDEKHWEQIWRHLQREAKDAISGL